jgi:hypothetical protein
MNYVTLKIYSGDDLIKSYTDIPETKVSEIVTNWAYGVEIPNFKFDVEVGGAVKSVTA